MRTALFLGIAVLTAPEELSPALDAFLDELAQRRAGIQTVRAVYQEENFLPDETFTTAGKILYIKPGRIVRHTQDPRSTILVDRRTGYLYEPDLAQLQIFQIEEDPQSDVLFFGFDEDARRLLEAYDLRLLQRDGQRGLLITPKFNPYRDPLFEELSILFAGEYLLPASIEVVNDDGSKTVYRVSDYAVNIPLDPAESQIQLAEGTTIIENNQLREKVGSGGMQVPEPLVPGEAPVAGVVVPLEAPATAETHIQLRELEPLVPAEPAAEQDTP